MIVSHTTEDAQILPFGLLDAKSREVVIAVSAANFVSLDGHTKIA